MTASPARQRLLLSALCGVLFFHGLGDRDLHSSHEARAAQNAQMVLSEGHWLLPRLYDGHLELQKPPLYYWLVALLGWAGGGEVGPWAVRLPAALSALGCVLFVHLLGCRRGRPVAGFVAAGVLATSLHFTWLARIGRIDMPLTLAITVALGSFHLGGLRWNWLGYTALAAGVLLKGPIALVLPGIIAAGAILTRPPQAPAAWRYRSLAWGVPWMVMLAAPWFLWANVETGGRLWDVFFWHHNIERGLGGSEALKAYPWWFYAASGLIDLLPWNLAVPVVAWAFWRRPELRADGEARLGLCWFGAVFLFLSCMSFKRADYLLPAFPGFAILVGCTVERSMAGIHRVPLGWGIGTAIVAVCLGWTAHNTWLVPRQEGDWPYARLAAEVRAQTAAPVIFFRAESHLLAYHVGRPLDTILEWENLAWWADRPFVVYIIMPEDQAAEWPRHLGPGQLEEVVRTRDRVPGRRERALVVLRTTLARRNGGG